MDVLPQLSINEGDNAVYEIDAKDKQILVLLNKNARAPLSKIAKQVSLSRDSVKYRLNNLVKHKVIRRTQTVVDIKSFAYEPYHIFLRLNNPSREVELRFVKEISSLPYVRALVRFYGPYDFEIAVIAKNIQEFDLIFTDITSKVKGYLQGHEILILTKTFRSGAFPNNFLKSRVVEKRDVKKNIKKQHKIDATDSIILKLIRNNAQLSLLDIAEKIKLSPDAASYRLKRLEESVILGYVPAINYKALGYSIHALLIAITDLDAENERKLIHFLTKNDRILWAVKTIGKYNVLIYTCTQNDRELQETVASLRILFPENIKNYDSLLGITEYIYTYVPDCLLSDTETRASKK